MDQRTTVEGEKEMKPAAESTLNTSAVLEGIKKRQHASQLILLAIVDTSPSNIREVHSHLLACLANLKGSAEKDFYFDLGWLDTPESILDDFSSLNWVTIHHSVTSYQSTTIGKAALIEKWEELQTYLGISLSDFQKLCK
jgi:hypothetical protein